MSLAEKVSPALVEEVKQKGREAVSGDVDAADLAEQGFLRPKLLSFPSHPQPDPCSISHVARP